MSRNRPLANVFTPMFSRDPVMFGRAQAEKASRRPPVTLKLAFSHLLLFSWFGPLRDLAGRSTKVLSEILHYSTSARYSFARSRKDMIKSTYSLNHICTVNSFPKVPQNIQSPIFGRWCFNKTGPSTPSWIDEVVKLGPSAPSVVRIHILKIKLEWLAYRDSVDLQRQEQ